MTPAEHLARITALFPKFWHQYDAFRAHRDTLNGWPSWCYCPLAGAYAIVSGGGDGVVSPERAHPIGELGAVAAWRPTKGIYRFDPTLTEALVSTPLERALPPGVLERLPEWCVWVDPVAGLPGFFAHLEHDSNDGRAELRLYMDSGDGLLSVIVHLDRGSLSDGVDAAPLEGTAQMAIRSGMTVPSPEAGTGCKIAHEIAPCVSLLLYLCAEEPDWGGREPPKHPSSRGRTTR